MGNHYAQTTSCWQMTDEFINWRFPDEVSLQVTANKGKVKSNREQTIQQIVIQQNMMKLETNVTVFAEPDVVASTDVVASKCEELWNSDSSFSLFFLMLL